MAKENIKDDSWGTLQFYQYHRHQKQNYILKHADITSPYALAWEAPVKKDKYKDEVTGEDK